MKNSDRAVEVEEANRWQEGKKSSPNANPHVGLARAILHILMGNLQCNNARHRRH